MDSNKPIKIQQAHARKLQCELFLFHIPVPQSAVESKLTNSTYKEISYSVPDLESAM